jgi:hypothetical protein
MDADPTVGTIERKPKPRIWVNCPGCNEERWAPYSAHKFFFSQRLCRTCNTNKAKHNFNLQSHQKDDDKPMRHVLR